MLPAEAALPCMVRHIGGDVEHNLAGVWRGPTTLEAEQCAITLQTVGGKASAALTRVGEWPGVAQRGGLGASNGNTQL